VFMPEGLVPGSVRLARWALKAIRPPAAPAAGGPSQKAGAP